MGRRNGSRRRTHGDAAADRFLETCFGRIVEGQAILDVMASHHEKNFRGMAMVGIETVRVLKPSTDPIADPRLVTSEIDSTSY
jgi:hypothetical protein